MAVQYTFFNDVTPPIKASFYSKDVKSQEIKDLWRKDLYYLIASVVLVFVILTFHFCSAFLGIICMLIIGFSFGCTGLLCEYALGMTYFNIMNNFAIFIILGIAADDFIVLFDAWTQSGNFRLIKNDVRSRLAFTLRRSARTIFMTSSTTAVAFLACYFSPIMKIRAFGLFSAILVPVTFLLTLFVMLPAIAFRENCGHFCTCCFKR